MYRHWYVLHILFIVLLFTCYITLSRFKDVCVRVDGVPSPVLHGARNQGPPKSARGPQPALRLPRLRPVVLLQGQERPAHPGTQSVIYTSFLWLTTHCKLTFLQILWFQYQNRFHLIKNPLKICRRIFLNAENINIISNEYVRILIF